MSILTIDAEYKITIPVELRDQLGWQPGTRLALLPQPDGSILIEEVEPSADPVSKGQ